MQPKTLVEGPMLGRERCASTLISALLGGAAIAKSSRVRILPNLACGQGLSDEGWRG